MRKIIASIDLGSDTIKIIVCEVIKDRLHLLASSETETKGIKAGLIINENDLINSLQEGIKKIEDMLGLKLNKVLVSVPSNEINFCLGEGITTLTTEDKMVGSADIVRALQASSYNKISANEELVTLIPLNFIINETEEVKNPKGLVTEKLGVKSVIISAPKENVYSIIKCFEKIGMEVIDINLNSIGDYYANKNEEIDNEIGALINLGSETTTVSVFNKGVLTNTEIIPLGGANIDNDISFIYKLNKSDAKSLKEKIGLAHRRLADASITEELTNKLGEKIKINQYELTEIVTSRLGEILDLAKKQINLLTKKEIHYIIITGGLTEIADFDLLVEEIFGHHVILSKINTLGIRNNKYSNSIGMIKYFDEKLRLRDKNFSIFNKEETEELETVSKRINVSNDSIIGKIFGYFFDN